MKEPGWVYLVGAGPGDPGLITARGAFLLGCCDCIIYDHLASEELLAYGRQGCERLYVGKQKGVHAKSQEEINRLQSSSVYQTEEQKSETADKIGDIQSEMTANQETIQSHEQQITEIRERIALLKEQISQ